MRIHEKLSAAKVKSLPPGRYVDGGGLHLLVRKTGSRSWVYRWQRLGRQRDIGLGPYPDVSLKAAREKAAELRAMVQRGQVPAIEKPQPELTFAEVALACIESRKAGWSNKKHAQQWENTLAQYAFPVLGSMDPRHIQAPDVIRALKSIWNDKPETASRVRQRIETVLDHARVKGLREGDNPASWKGNLDSVFPKRTAVAGVKNFEAVPFTLLPGLYKSLKKSESASSLCLRWIILTACRSNEGRSAMWSEITIERGCLCWTIPAARTKTKRPHSVPLTDEMKSIIENAKNYDDKSGFIFPSPSGSVLSDVAVSKALKSRLEPDQKGTVHGMRSCFKDWCLEKQPLIPDHVSEACLAHVSGDRVRDAYARTDLQDQKKELLHRWNIFLVSGERRG
ncbi:tyrosine-type recombinase/integrase [Desulfobotulus pelophilus]|uniref:tyrosine-type recombinase/integrase n=1 Tax=Desulfobotulus pelophilus TaxID=2823377 RepID=UPI0034A3EA9D